MLAHSVLAPDGITNQHIQQKTAIKQFMKEIHGTPVPSHVCLNDTPPVTELEDFRHVVWLSYSIIMQY